METGSSRFGPVQVLRAPPLGALTLRGRHDAFSLGMLPFALLQTSDWNPTMSVALDFSRVSDLRITTKGAQRLARAWCVPGASWATGRWALISSQRRHGEPLHRLLRRPLLRQNFRLRQFFDIAAALRWVVHGEKPQKAPRLVGAGGH